MIHADFLTHRRFSRNGRSSRAVPGHVLLKEAENPYVPHFMKNKPGMSASEEFDEETYAAAEAIWRDMADYTRKGVELLHKLGVHKQWANRPLEWFGYIDVLVSSTNWTNYYELRKDGNGAQPEISVIAESIKSALDSSVPKAVDHGEWHRPYYDSEADDESVKKYIRDTLGIRHKTKELVTEISLKVSAARCARLSIEPFDGNGNIEREIERYRKLVESMPIHASPVEHQATPDVLVRSGEWANRELHGNFVGWIQNRKQFGDEDLDFVR